MAAGVPHLRGLQQHHEKEQGALYYDLGGGAEAQKAKEEWLKARAGEHFPVRKMLPCLVAHKNHFVAQKATVSNAIDKFLFRIRKHSASENVTFPFAYTPCGDNPIYFEAVALLPFCSIFHTFFRFRMGNVIATRLRYTSTWESSYFPLWHDNVL